MTAYSAISGTLTSNPGASSPRFVARQGRSSRRICAGVRGGITLRCSDGAATKSGRGSCQKEDRSADRTGSGSSKKAPRERDPASDSVDDARRLYVKNKTFVRTKCELKKAGETTERRKAPRSSDVGSFRDFRVGRRERLYERKRES